MKNAPKIIDYLSDEDKAYFDKVLKCLDTLGVEYVIEQKLVRGLDYYNHTVFEFIYDDEKSNINGLTLLGGGRYNGLSKQFDGPETEAIGFGTGVERLMLVLDELGLYQDDEKLVDVVVINIGEETKLNALDLAAYLRRNNVSCELDYVSSNLKPQFKLSERVNAPYIIIIGLDEVEQGVFKLKNTVLKTEEMKNIEQLNEIFNIEGEKYAYKK
jgi:histidyl-tRNA synthetase